MKNRPKVSILIPTYNVENYLTDALESIVHQTLKEIEVICVNDGSTDSSLKILQRYAKNYPFIKIVDQPNQGYGAAMNRGLDEAQGEYIGIVEPDDWIGSEMFNELYQAAKTHQLDMVKSDFGEFGSQADRTVPILKPEGKYNQVVDMTQDFFTIGNTPGIWTGIYRFDWLKQHGIRFNTTPRAAYQDTGFYFLTTIHAQRAMFIPKVFYHYRVDNPASSRNIKGQTFVINREFYYLERKLRENYSDWEKYRFFFHYRKLLSYFWNLDRISEDDKLPFIRRMGQEFGWSLQRGDIDESYFLAWQIGKMRGTINDPEGFYYTNYATNRLRQLERELKVARNRVQTIENSSTWKVGKLVTFIPRWIKRRLKGQR